MGGGTGGGDGGTYPPLFSAFNIMLTGGAWKESTSNGPCPPIVAPWRRPWGGFMDVESGETGGGASPAVLEP